MLLADKTVDATVGPAILPASPLSSGLRAGESPAPPFSPATYYQAVRIASDLSPEMAACAAANLAMGTRYGEQDT
jgi:hypothetical protein